MLAEIKGKISSSGSNLSNRLEDKLTGDVFGALRYIPFSLGLKQILLASSFPPDQKKELEIVLNQDENFKYEFWPRFEEGEPDLILESENAIILIEVKFQSGLSSDDAIEDPELSRNQLAREAQILHRTKGNKKAFLLFLAKQSEAASIYSKTLERKQILNDINFGYLSWSTVLEVLAGIQGNESLSFPFDIIIRDIVNLLRKKGFETFKNFKIESKQIYNNIFVFNSVIKKRFTFNFNQPVNKNYYEFR